MKAKSFQITALTPQLQKDVDVVLLYGTDDGEIYHTLTQLKKILGISSDSLNAITLTKESLKKTPFLATDEANTTSLIAQRRFLFIPEDVSFPVSSLQHFLDQKKTDALLIIQGGNLSKTSALRQESEQNPRILAISCYQPTIPEIQAGILAYLKQNHKKITSPVVAELLKKIPLNQQLMKQELDKLLLYVGEKAEITLPDIQACIANNSDVSLENLCISLADGRVAEVQQTASIFLETEESETNLFWTIRDYFERLLLILSDNSAPASQVVKKYLKPAQFRLERPLAQQTRFWTQDTVLSTLNKLTQLEELTRQTGYPKNTIILQTLIGIAAFAKRLAGLR